jgi:hypothetical protein
MSSTLTITCSDGVEVVLPRERIIKASGTIKGMIEEMGEMDTIPISNVTSQCFELIKEYLEIQAKTPTPEPTESEKHTINILPHDQEFINKIYHTQILAPADQTGADMIFHLTLAANYLDIKSLLRLMTMAIATIVKSTATKDEVTLKLSPSSEVGPVSSDSTPMEQ